MRGMVSCSPNMRVVDLCRLDYRRHRVIPQPGFLRKYSGYLNLFFNLSCRVLGHVSIGRAILHAYASAGRPGDS